MSLLVQPGVTTIPAVSVPYPGLRPFEPRDSDLFFGRETQVQNLMSRLRDTRFLAVVGESGSGKSSLVRAGLLPSLRKGFLFEEGPRWEYIITEPGDDPFGRLSRRISHLAEISGNPAPSLLLESVLKSSATGLAECARGLLQPGKNLLVVIDQFEEIFGEKRKQNAAVSEDRAAFVHMLLEAASQRAVPVYVLLTMRSDFLGRCQEFNGLPEALNRSQFLVPRMNREELRLAIAGPARMFQVDFSSGLIDVLLNEIGNTQDQLPVLQHALAQTWDAWRSRDGREPNGLDYELDYKPTGGIRGALNKHAGQLFGSLTPRGKIIARKLFQSITSKPADSEPMRRPTRLNRIYDIAAASPELAALTLDEVKEVINHFRKGANFLRPYIDNEPEERELIETTRVDISHESLMRNWTTLAEWIQSEHRVALAYRELVVAARRYYGLEPGQAGRLWGNPELPDIRKRLAEHPWSEPWALQYGTAEDYALAEKFIGESTEREKAAAEARKTEERDRQKLESRRRFVPILAALLLLAAMAAAYGFWQSRVAGEKAAQAETSRRIAEGNRAWALQQKALADSEKSSAEAAREQAEKDRVAAVKAAEVARQAEGKAVQEEHLAQIAQARAEEQARVASENAEMARRSAAEAAAQKALAEDEKRKAEQRAVELAAANKRIDEYASERDSEARIARARSAAERSLNRSTPGIDPARFQDLLQSVKDLAAKDLLLGSSVRALRKTVLSSLAIGNSSSPEPVVAASGPADSIVIFSKDGELSRWDLKTGMPTRIDSLSNSSPKKNLDKFAISSDGKLALAAGERGYVYSLDTVTGKETHTRLNDFPITALNFSADDKIVAVGSSSGWWRTFSRHRAEHPFNPPVQLTMRVLAGIQLSLALLFDQVPKHYPVQSFTIVSSAGPVARKSDVLLSTLSEWGSGKLWYANHNQITRKDPDFSGVKVQAAHPTLPLIAEAMQTLIADARQNCVGLRTSRTLSRLPICTSISDEPNQYTNVTALAWSGNGARLAAGLADGGIVLMSYDSDRRALKRDAFPILPAHAAAVSVLRWNKDGTSLFSASEDRSVRWWDLSPDPSVQRILDLLNKAAPDPAADVIPIKQNPGFDFGELLQLLDAREKKLAAGQVK